MSTAPSHHLILLPGLEGTGKLCAPLLAALPARYSATVVVYPSDAPLGYAELHALALKSLPKKRPFILFGESFGGPLALRLAATHPPGLQAVVLCATFISNPLPPALGRWLPRARGAWFRFTPPKFAVRRFVAGDDAAPEMVRTFQQTLRSVRPETLAHRVRELAAADAAPDLRNCRVPILYLQAQRDRLVRSHNARRILAVRPDVTVVSIDAPHLLLQTKPYAVVDALDAFLAPGSCGQSSQSNERRPGH